MITSHTRKTKKYNYISYVLQQFPFDNYSSISLSIAETIQTTPNEIEALLCVLGKLKKPA